MQSGQSQSVLSPTFLLYQMNAKSELPRMPQRLHCGFMLPVMIQVAGQQKGFRGRRGLGTRGWNVLGSPGA